MDPLIPTFAAFRGRLQALGDDPAATALATAYLAAHAGALPIMEGDTAHFLYQASPGTEVGIAGEWNGMDARHGQMEPLGGGLLHYAATFPPGARLDYLLYETSAPPAGRRRHPFDPARARAFRDPGNPRTGESGFGDRSELAVPPYARPAATVVHPTTPTGLIHSSSLDSAVLGETRPYFVYLPAGYDEAADPLPSILFHDGGDYLRMGHAPTTLDNLIAAGVIPPVVAIFVPPLHREREYNCDDRYVAFLTNELLPRVERDYAVSRDRDRRATMGPSMGGLIALYLGAQRPDLFGGIGAQSSVVRGFGGNTTFDARTALAAPRLPQQIHLVIGTYEACFGRDRQGRCRDLLTPVRALRAVLEPRGPAFDYAEHPQGHSWGLWRDDLPAALRHFFGAPGSRAARAD